MIEENWQKHRNLEVCFYNKVLCLFPPLPTFSSNTDVCSQCSESVQIQLTADGSKVRGKCECVALVVQHGVWKSLHQRTSTAAFIWKSECSSASTAGWGSTEKQICPHTKKTKTITQTHCAHTFLHIVRTNTIMHIHTKCMHIYSHSNILCINPCILHSFSNDEYSMRR